MSPEYNIVQQLLPELTTAVKDDLIEICNLLLKDGMITEVQHEEFTDPRLGATSHARASKLIRTVLNRIRIDPRNFVTFVKALKEKELYYQSILDKLNLNCSMARVENTQLSIDTLSDSESSDHESSAFITQRPNTQPEEILDLYPEFEYHQSNDLDELLECCFVMSPCPLAGLTTFIFFLSMVLHSTYYPSDFNNCYAFMYLLLFVLCITVPCFLCIVVWSSNASNTRKIVLSVVIIILIWTVWFYAAAHFCSKF